MNLITFQDIEEASPFPIVGYQINTDVRHIERTLEHYRESYGLDLEPDFQRAHVWTEQQQSAFIEYMLQRGPSGMVIYFACEGWQGARMPGKMILVDGKQRLEALRKFIRNDLVVFGKYKMSDIGGVLRMVSSNMQIAVVDCDRPAMLRWYLALNGGGTPHTKEELDKVRELLRKEMSP